MEVFQLHSSRKAFSMTTLSLRARLRRALADDAARRPPPPVATVSAAGTLAPTPPPATAMPNAPLRLTDDQLSAVMRAAEPLAVGNRDGFLRDVAAALQGRELGDGDVYRVVAQVQRRYWDPPIVAAGPRWER
jgi:hypothetical protein